MALSTALGFIGSGDVYLQPYLSSGNGLGKMLDVGNTTKFTIKPNSDRKQQISKKRDTYGNPLTTFSQLKPAEVNVTLETVNRANLRLAFMGEDATYSQASGTVTGETQLASLDAWVQLAKENLTTAAVTVTKGATALVEGIDFTVNRRIGMLQILSVNTKGVIDGDSLTVGYAYAAFTGAAIRGNVNAQIRAYLLLDGQNMVDLSIGILRVPSIVLAPTSEFDWFADDYNKVDLSGSLEVATGYTEAFKFYAR